MSYFIFLHCRQWPINTSRARVAHLIGPRYTTAFNETPQEGVNPSYRDTTTRNGWLGSRVVSVLDSDAEGPGFESQPRRCRVTVLGKLLIPIVPLFTNSKIGSIPTAGFMTHITCRRHLPRTGISSATLRSVIEYGLPLPLSHVRFPRL